MSSGGVSNVFFLFPGTTRFGKPFMGLLYHAIKAGLTMGIVNAGQLEIYEEIPPELKDKVEDVILNRSANGTEALLAVADQYREGGSSGKKRKIWPGGNGLLTNGWNMRWSKALPPGLLTILKQQDWPPAVLLR